MKTNGRQNEEIREVFARVDFRRRRSFADPIGKEAEKMRKVLILTFRSVKVKAAEEHDEYGSN
jgi:hypothetical protein